MPNETIRFEDYERLIHSAARKAHRRLRAHGRGMAYEDVFQEMCITWLKCRETFDPSRGFQFSTYFMNAAYFNINKTFTVEWEWENHTPKSLDAAVGPGDTRMLGEAITVEDKDGSPESQLSAVQQRELNLSDLSSTARLIMELLESPPPALVNELKALNARNTFALQRGLRHVAAKPHSLRMVHVATALRLTRRERLEIGEELDVMVADAT